MSGTDIDVLKDALKCLESIGVLAFITDGTLLGFYREGGFLAHDTDMDLGVMVDEYSDEIIPVLEQNGFQLLHVFGQRDNGLEYSFTKDDAKFDIFFYYRLDNRFWYSTYHLGMQLKHSCVAFSLKSAEFLGVTVLTPDDPIRFIEDKYGKNWKDVVTRWHWAFSPGHTEVVTTSVGQWITFKYEKLKWDLGTYFFIFNKQRK